MSKQPPDDEEFLQALLKQVRDALGDSPTGQDDELQDELMTGVRNSMQALMGMLSDDDVSLTVVDGNATDPDDMMRSLQGLMGIVPEMESRPAVRLMDGGRGADEPPSDKPRPQLRLADVNESITSEEEAVDDALSEEAYSNQSYPKIKVHVVRGEQLQNNSSAVGKEDHNQPPDGLIKLRAEGDEQYLLIGQEMRSYRIHCQEGKLNIIIEQQQLPLQEGQSIDVQGLNIRVQCASESALGRFYRVVE